MYTCGVDLGPVRGMEIGLLTSSSRSFDVPGLVFNRLLWLLWSKMELIDRADQLLEVSR